MVQNVVYGQACVVTAMQSQPKILHCTPLKLDVIDECVQVFLQFADDHPNFIFNVTAIGCGYARYTPEDIAPMFAGHGPNVKLPSVFKDVLEKKSKWKIINKRTS